MWGRPGAYNRWVDFAAARERMIERQIVARGVQDARVLDAMRAVQRHLFVPEAARHAAYDDRALPLAEGQTISQPYMVAVMTQTLDPAPHHRVLEIGTGSGYQTAVLARLAADVHSIERLPTLAARARQTLGALAVANVAIHVGDGTEGLPEHAPFDRILVTAGAPSVPESLQRQLALDGRLVIPVGPAGFQHLITITRVAHDRFDRHESEACVFVPLIGRYGWPETP
jgi:protein-L-isoaspartate(D-aspartate) O-methyltransferase